MELVPVAISYTITIDREIMEYLVNERKVISDYHGLLVSKLEAIEGVGSADYDSDMSAVYITINAQDDNDTLHRMISRTIIQHLVMCRRRIRRGP